MGWWAGTGPTDGVGGGIRVHFGDRLNRAVAKAGNPVLVGIDPRPENLPAGFREKFPGGRRGLAEAIGAFAREVVDAVAGVVPAVKFQTAFFERYGPEGLVGLREAAVLARSRGLVVVIDGKRNDIGTTAEAYARAYLECPHDRPTPDDDPAWEGDALTVNPYLGSDGIEPFIRVAALAGNGLFVLVRTSNPSAVEFQDLVCDGKPVYRHVAEHLADWAGPHRGASGYSFVGAVVGATYPKELAELRAALPGVILLVPGYGAQGGTAADVAGAFDQDGRGAIVNSSRGVAFAYERPEFRAHNGPNWARAIESAARQMAQDLAANTPAGRLAG